MKKILITGGSGFIGTNLVNYLIQKNYNITNIDKLSYAGNIANINTESKNISFYQKDILDENLNENQLEDEINRSAISFEDLLNMSLNISLPKTKISLRSKS